MSAATNRQIETLESLVNEINDIITKAKNSKYDRMIKRAMEGVITMVEAARKSCDKAKYASAIGMLIRRKKYVQNIINSYRN